MAVSARALPPGDHFRAIHSKDRAMALEKFHHDHDGQEIILPKFKHTPVGVIRKVRAKNEAEQIFTVLEAVADDGTLAIIDTMDTEQLQDMIKAWQSDSGATVGESSASAS